MGTETDNKEAVAPAGYVRREGKVFELGEYEDQQFALNEAEADRAIALFTPVAGDLEHKPTILSGKVGIMQDIWREGTAIWAKIDEPEWLASLREGPMKPVSCAWDRATKTLTGWGWVLDPAITDAAVFNAHAEFTKKYPDPQAKASVPARAQTTQSQKRRGNMSLLATKVQAMLDSRGKKGDEATASAAAPGSVTIGNATFSQADILRALANLQAGASADDKADGAEGAEKDPKTVAAFAAPGQDAEVMDEGTAEFKTSQIISRAEELADRYVAEGRLHEFAKEAAVAAFAAAGFDNEEYGPSVATFTNGEGKVIRDRVQLLIELLNGAPKHSLFAKTLPVIVHNATKDPSEKDKGPEQQGLAQAAEFNKQMGGQAAAIGKEQEAALAGAAK